MRLRAAGLALLSLLLLALPIGSSRAAAPARNPLLSTTSDSFYRLNVAEGTMNVRVEAEFIGQPGTTEQKEVVFWAMPGATNVVAKQGDDVLTVKTEKAPPPADVITIARATLARPMKGQVKTNLVLTYDVPAQKSEYVQVAAGYQEAMLVSQGPGSFVLVDAPAGAETLFDPGCLKGSDQPKDVKAAGFERWVCGEVTLAALSSDDATAQQWCANMDERCRQRYLRSPFTAFVQSTTDSALRGTLEAEVPMAKGPVKLTFRFFQADRAWAERQFKVAQVAFPRLEQIFGYPYGRTSVVMLESHHIELVGAVGVAFDRIGQVLLSPDAFGLNEQEVTVHELAHQWAGSGLETNWMWEGLAEWGMRALAPELGFKPYDRGWQKKPYTDPLSSMYSSSRVYDPDYWYGKAGAFWAEYEKAVGGRTTMTAILALSGPKADRAPVDGRWFMDVGERASGANLDSLFLQWVWNGDQAAALLAQRRAAHDSLAPLMQRAVSLGTPGYPADIQTALDAWDFDGIAARLPEAQRVLDAYESLLAQVKAAGLAPNALFAGWWAEKPLSQTAGLVENERQALLAITASAGQLADQPEGSPARDRLAKAREAFAAGRLDEAKQLAASAVTGVANTSAAEKAIASAKERQHSFSPSIFERVGLFFADPDGDLAAAEAALAAGEPEKAYGLAKSAEGAWDGAEGQGLLRLAGVAGLIFVVALAGWGLRERAYRAAKRQREQAEFEAARRAPPRYTWRDYQ